MVQVWVINKSLYLITCFGKKLSQAANYQRANINKNTDELCVNYPFDFQCFSGNKKYCRFSKKYALFEAKRNENALVKSSCGTMSLFPLSLSLSTSIPNRQLCQLGHSHLLLSLP
jgi:hypothetical protein